MLRGAAGSEKEKELCLGSMPGDKAGSLGPRGGLRCPEGVRVPSPEAPGLFPGLEGGGWGSGPLAQHGKSSLTAASLLWELVSGIETSGRKLTGTEAGVGSLGGPGGALGV